MNNLSFYQLLLSYIYVLIIFIIMKLRKIDKTRELLISSIRMSIQLLITGYLLVLIFKKPSIYISTFILLVMETFSVLTIFKKFKNKLCSNMKKVIIFSKLIGTSFSILYFIIAIVQIRPWYTPQYLIPISGMLVGNTMTGIILALNSLLNGFSSERVYIEEALILGAKENIATKDLINKSFDTAIIPTINSMIGMGIVFLPGMMTGQILSGTSPINAIFYQIAIMFGILGSVGLTTILVLYFGAKTFFNNEIQLVREGVKE